MSLPTLFHAAILAQASFHGFDKFGAIMADAKPTRDRGTHTAESLGEMLYPFVPKMKCFGYGAKMQDSARQPLALVAKRDILNKIRENGGLIIISAIAIKAFQWVHDEKLRNKDQDWELEEEDVDAWAKMMSDRLRTMACHYKEALRDKNPPQWCKLMSKEPESKAQELSPPRAASPEDERAPRRPSIDRSSCSVQELPVVTPRKRKIEQCDMVSMITVISFWNGSGIILECFLKRSF